MNLKVDSKADGVNPFTRICYICGRQFGSKSIVIHERACLEKFEQSQAHLPKSQRKSPPKPFDLPLNASAKEYNEAAYQTYLEQGRVECPNCSRKFLQDRLEIHLKSCTPGGYFSRKSMKSVLPSVSSVSNESCIKALEKKAVGVKKAIPSSVAPNTGKGDPDESKSGHGKSNLFCTECGERFPLESAKFCGQCGTKRV